jgi:hypothetical protein
MYSGLFLQKLIRDAVKAVEWIFSITNDQLESNFFVADEEDAMEMSLNL